MIDFSLMALLSLGLRVVVILLDRVDDPGPVQRRIFWLMRIASIVSFGATVLLVLEYFRRLAPR